MHHPRFHGAPTADSEGHKPPPKVEVTFAISLPYFVLDNTLPIQTLSVVRVRNGPSPGARGHRGRRDRTNAAWHSLPPAPDNMHQ